MFRGIISALLLLLPGAAYANWNEATSAHFVVYSESSPRELSAFTKELEVYDKALRALWGFPEKKIPKTQRVTIFVVDDVAAIQRLLPGRNAAGFYSARVSGPVAFVPLRSNDVLSTSEILRHEYAHQFMFANWTNNAFPAWFSEGFAEFSATADFRSDGSVIFGAMPRYRNYMMLRAGTLPMNMLLQPSFEGFSDEQIEVAYSRGWLLTHYLLTQPAQREHLIAYLKAFNAGKEDEANQALGGINDMLLSSYIRRSGLPSLRIGADKLKVQDIQLRALKPDEAATMAARIRSTAGVNKETAPAVATLARRIAAAFPQSAAAQRELAEAEYDAGNYDASLAAADRAIGADPNMVDAHIYRGMAAMAKASKDNVTDADAWDDIRQSFLAANRIDTENPMALELFYESFARQGVSPTRNAKDALLYAYRLAPYDLGLRMEAGEVLLGIGAGHAAQDALRPVAYSPHGGKDAKVVRNVLTMIDSDGVKAADAYLHKAREDIEAQEEKKAASH